MTPEEFKQKMIECSESVYKSTGNKDVEGSHEEADVLMCELLRELGYGDGVTVFQRMEKWYA